MFTCNWVGWFMHKWLHVTKLTVVIPWHTSALVDFLVFQVLVGFKYPTITLLQLRTMRVAHHSRPDLEFSGIVLQFATRKVTNWVQKADCKTAIEFFVPQIKFQMSNHWWNWRLHLILKELHLNSQSEGQFCTSGKNWKFQDWVSLNTHWIKPLKWLKLVIWWPSFWRLHTNCALDRILIKKRFDN